MNAKRYEQLVTSGKKWVKSGNDLQWKGGDLALKVAPVYQDGGRRSERQAREAVTQWIRDIGWEGAPNTMMNYRRIAQRWPLDRRVKGASWRAHEVLSKHKDRFKLLRPGMTAEVAAAAAGEQAYRHAQRGRGRVDAGAAMQFLRGSINFVRRADLVLAASDTSLRDERQAQALLLELEEAVFIMSDRISQGTALA